jgi:hypothetical protein
MSTIRRYFNSVIADLFGDRLAFEGTAIATKNRDEKRMTVTVDRLIESEGIYCEVIWDEDAEFHSLLSVC